IQKPVGFHHRYSQPTVGQWTDVPTHPELEGMAVRAGVFAEQLIQSSGEAAHPRRQVLGVDARHVTIPGVLAEGALLPRRTETDGRHGHREQTADVLVDLLHPSAGQGTEVTGIDCDDGPVGPQLFPLPATHVFSSEGGFLSVRRASFWPPEGTV